MERDRLNVEPTLSFTEGFVDEIINQAGRRPKSACLGAGAGYGLRNPARPLGHSSCGATQGSLPVPITIVSRDMSKSA